MAIRYLLPCPQCGHASAVAITQAGQEIVCGQCARTFEVPQMQAIKQLPITGAVPGAVKSRPLVRGSLFVIGLALAILGATAGYSLQRYGNSMIFLFDDPEGQIAETANSLSRVQVLQAWYDVENSPELPEWREMPVVRYQNQGKILKQIGYGFWGLGGLGLLTLIASFIFRPKS